MSAVEDLCKARAAVYGGVWTWEHHGDGWALYVDRGQPLFPDQPRGICNIQHGLNILTIGSGGFDSRGEQLRAFVLAAAEKVPLLAAEQGARDAAWARLVKAAASDMDAMHMSAADPTDTTVEEHAQKTAEYWTAVKALRDLGVNVDDLLRAT